MQKWPRKAIARWMVSVATEIFFVTTELFDSVSQHGSLCRDIVPRLQESAGSRQGFSWSRQSCFLLYFCCNRGPHGVAIVFWFSVVTMLRQRFPRHDR